MRPEVPDPKQATHLLPKPTPLDEKSEEPTGWEPDFGVRLFFFLKVAYELR